MKQLIVNRDPGSVPLYARQITDSGKQIYMAADTDYSTAVPAGARFALFNGDGFFYVSGASITLPGAGVWTSADMEGAPSAIEIDGETALHVRARNIVEIAISFYR